MMFLEENPSSPFETIAYNDFEYLDDYESLNGFFVRFINSGLPTMGNTNFNDLLRLPNHLADWIVDWATKQTVQSGNDNDVTLRKLEEEMLKANQQTQKQSKTKDPFSTNY